MEIVFWFGSFGVFWVCAAIHQGDYPNVWPFNHRKGDDDEPEA